MNPSDFANEDLAKKRLAEMGARFPQMPLGGQTKDLDAASGSDDAHGGFMVAAGKLRQKLLLRGITK